MEMLRNRKNLAAASRETPETTRNGRSKNTLDRRIPRSTSPRYLKKLKGESLKKLSEEFRWTESRILCALSKFDEFLLNPQVRTCSVPVPATSRNNGSENREPTGNHSLGSPCPEAVFCTCHSSDLTIQSRRRLYTW